MFKRPSIRYAKTPQAETPYQRAAQVWDERIGSARVQAKSWRYAFFGALGLSAALTGGLVWQNARGTIVPWVVEVDRLGEARPDDPIVVRENWLRAYQFASDKGALALNDYARANDPFAAIGREQVAVDVTSVIRASPRSFRVAWVERRYRDGALAETTRWTAILGVAVQPPRTPDALTSNPLGIFVTSINWSKELG